MNGTSIGDDVARAKVLGIALRVNAAADRITDPLPAEWPAATGPTVTRPTVARYSLARRDWRGPAACPTCDDGLRTIESPARCRECVKGGL